MLLVRKLSHLLKGFSIKYLVILIIVVLSSTFLTSCAERNYLEDLGLQTALGYDLTKEGKIKGTSVLHHFKQVGESPVQVLTATAETSKGFRQAMNLKTSKKLVSGQIRLALFGEETAKKGIISLLDSLSRDPKIGTMLYVAVAKGTAREVLSYNYKDIQNIGIYIYHTINQNIDGEQVVSPTLHEILYAYYSEGQDSVLPYIVQEKDKIEIDGMALFQGDKMVGTIEAREGFFLKLLRDRFEAGELELVLPKQNLKQLKGPNKTENIKINIDNIHSDTKIKLINKERPEFDVKIDITAKIQEISEEIDLGKPEAIKKLTQLITAQLEKEANLLMKKLQRLESDVVGFGRIYNHSIRGKHKTLDKWYPTYKEAKINITVNTSIMNAGVMD